MLPTYHPSPPRAIHLFLFFHCYHYCYSCTLLHLAPQPRAFQYRIHANPSNPPPSKLSHHPWDLPPQPPTLPPLPGQRQPDQDINLTSMDQDNPPDTTQRSCFVNKLIFTALIVEYRITSLDFDLAVAGRILEGPHRNTRRDLHKDMQRGIQRNTQRNTHTCSNIHRNTHRSMQRNIIILSHTYSNYTCIMHIHIRLAKTIIVIWTIIIVIDASMQMLHFIAPTCYAYYSVNLVISVMRAH